MKVLHVNARLSEGGAAGVANTLVDELSTLGVESRFAYGYGAHGGNSDQHNPDVDLRLTPRLESAPSLVINSMIGRDIFMPVSDSRLIAASRQADIVHIHVLHSYFVRAHAVMRKLAALGKPVIWTLHDQWLLSGRCAQPAACRKWETGCGGCPQLQAYPPARVDLTASGHRLRREALQEMLATGRTQLVACASWLGEEFGRAGLPTKVIHNSVDARFWNAVESGRRAHTSRGKKYLFICRDLRDRKKVDWALLEQIAQDPNSTLTVVGDHAPTEMANVRQLPANSNRRRMAEIMQQHTALIFTSQVDYYPLTIAEAVTAGLEVLAVSSPAAKEFAAFPQVRLFNSPGELLEDVRLSNARHFETQSAFEYFSPQRMAREYVREYEQALTHG